MSINTIRAATAHIDSDDINPSLTKTSLIDNAHHHSSYVSSIPESSGSTVASASLSSSLKTNTLSSFHPLNQSHLENPSSLSLADTDITESERSTKSPNTTTNTESDARSTSSLLRGSADDEEIHNISITEQNNTLNKMADACKTLLEGLGEDPNREGLLKTPMRMAKALVACTAGYNQDPKTIVADALFECSSDELVIVKDIELFSMCEHHMLPFYGKAHIGYIPNGKVVGLSKLARLTDCFAKRLQIQERLTQQIAQAIEECVGARGVAVVVEAAHMCMAMRGVEKPGALTVSSCFLGQLKDDRYLRSEFLNSVRNNGNK